MLYLKHYLLNIFVTITLIFSFPQISVANNPCDTLKSSNSDTLLIVGVGDIMLGTNYPSKAYLPANNDCKPLMADVLKYLINSDLTFGNLEGSFSDNAPLQKRCQDSTKCYAFRIPSAYFQCIADAGFDVLSLANNHTFDFGQAAVSNTIDMMQKAGIEYAGLLSHPYSIFTKNNVKYGFCAFSPNNNTTRIEDIKKATAIVTKLDSVCDIVIVSFHGGAEGRDNQHVTRKTEIFYGEDRGNVYQFAHSVIDAGADVVFGHGPHVTRAIEVYNNRFIAYSMGNFCTYSRINVTGPNGIAPIMRVYTNKLGKFVKGEIIPTYQIDGAGTKYDPNKQVIKKIIELTKIDFPEQKINITDQGLITIP